MARTQTRTAKQTDSHTEDDFNVPTVEEMRENSAKAAFNLQEAEEIWRLAAQLQAEEAHRQAETRQLQEEKINLPEQKFNLSEVSEIAKSAGIDPKFVAMALQNQQNLVAWETPTPQKTLEYATKYLNHSQERISVKKRFQLSKAETIKALQKVFKSSEYKISLIDQLPSPTDEVENFVFKIPLLTAAGTSPEGGLSYNSFAYHMSYADVNRIAVHIRALSENETEVEIQGDLKWGKRRNFLAGAFLNGIFTVLGGVLGFALGNKAEMGIWGAMAGSSVGTFGGLHLYRWIYRWGANKAEALLKELLDKVGTNAKHTGWI